MTVSALLLGHFHDPEKQLYLQGGLGTVSYVLSGLAVLDPLCRWTTLCGLGLFTNSNIHAHP